MVVHKHSQLQFQEIWCPAHIWCTHTHADKYICSLNIINKSKTKQKEALNLYSYFPHHLKKKKERGTDIGSLKSPVQKPGGNGTCLEFPSLGGIESKNKTKPTLYKPYAAKVEHNSCAVQKGHLSLEKLTHTQQ